ncbi:MAG: TlpA disulfide reductase family protein [Gemmatimonadota bacterium]
MSRRAAPGVARLTAVLAVVSCSIGPHALAAQSAVPDGLVVYGDADFEWAIRPLDGDAFPLEELRGRVLFINLWASWCTPCVREMASIEGLRNRLSDTEVEFLIVAADRERDVRRYLRRYTYDLPIYMEVSRIPDAFGMRGLPTSWLVDEDGRIVLLRHGEAVWDTDEVEAFVRAVAAGA